MAVMLVEDARALLGTRNEVDALYEALRWKMIAEQWQRRALAAEARVPATPEGHDDA